MGAMTKVKDKQSPTNIFGTFSKRLLKSEFIRRNRKVIILFLSIWLVANAAALFIYKNSVTDTNEKFFNQGISAAENLAAESESPVINDDSLALLEIIKDSENITDLKFAVILDHMNMVLMHTDTVMINKKFQLPEEQNLIKQIKEVKIISDVAPDGTEIFGFLKEIIFAKIGIGKVYLALSSLTFHNTLNRMKYFYIAWCSFAFIALIFAFYLLNRTAKVKASNILKEYESMDRIGPYVLLKKMAKGGMAELFLSDYLSEDGFRKQVAVKRILPHLAENTDFIQMFTREARLAALLHHPNIVQILDYKKIDNAYLIAMEYIDGKNLGEILSALKHGIPYEIAGYIISEVCKGLDYSHNKKDDLTGEPMNIVHRDISPQNILVSFRGEVKISDFGISKAQSEPSLTQVGVIKGKMSYLSPEQALGEPVDARVDIYALGLVFYEILTGKRVYQFDNDIEAIRTIPVMDIKPVIEELPGLPLELNDLVMKCLARNKDFRFQSALEVYKELVRLKKSLKINVEGSTLEDFLKKNFNKE